MKPLGISYGITENGPSFRVGVASKTEDLIWEAVETAQDSGWTPRRFYNEVVQAWEERMRDNIKDTLMEFKQINKTV